MPTSAFARIYLSLILFLGWGLSAQANLIWTLPDDAPLQAGKATVIKIQVEGPLGSMDEIEIEVNGKARNISLTRGKGSFVYIAKQDGESLTVTAEVPESMASLSKSEFPLWTSILPPLVAIVLALVFREVIVSLFLGVFVGAAVLGYYEAGSISGIFSGFLAVLDHYILDALNDPDHLAIILFSLLIGGMVAVISRNGGMMGIVNRIARIAKTAKSGQFATWLMGLVIFFDDYANTLVVGNTMRSITDKLRISREKLAYIVDSTAAPVSALAFITTWIGAELGYIEEGISTLANIPPGNSPYGIFLSSLSYSFYPILTLLFILMLVYMGRDFGPMLKAEMRARKTGEVSRADSLATDEEALKHFQPLAEVIPKAFNAVIPIVVLVLGVLIGLLYTGWEAGDWGNANKGFFGKLSDTIGEADSYAALMWASLTAVAVAIVLSLSQRMMNIPKAIETMTFGFKAMFAAVMILVLAWSLNALTQDMHTADFLTAVLGDYLSPAWLPAITFILGAIISFSTGSSWGTMAILYPIIIPLTWQVCIGAGLSPDAAMPILYNVVACVLAGSVLGDHCSPISDTTILSSLACSCDHIDHVRTQLPYALSVGAAALLLGTIPTGYGVPAWICFPFALVGLYAVIRFWGKPVPEASAS